MIVIFASAILSDLWFCFLSLRACKIAGALDFHCASILQHDSRFHIWQNVKFNVQVFRENCCNVVDSFKITEGTKSQMVSVCWNFGTIVFDVSKGSYKFNSKDLSLMPAFILLSMHYVSIVSTRGVIKPVQSSSCSCEPFAKTLTSLHEPFVEMLAVKLSNLTGRFYSLLDTGG